MIGRNNGGECIAGVARLMVALFAIATMFGADLPDPEFEVVSIRVAPPIQSGSTVSATTDPSMAVYNNATLAGLIMIAWGVRPYQMSGPDWMTDTRFNVQAKIPVGATKEQVPAMMQAMLKRRFGVQVKPGQKDVDGYSLVSAGSSRLVKADEDVGYKMGMKGPEMLEVAGKITMPRLAGILALQLGGPVMDATGLQGPFEVNLTWRPESRHKDDSVEAEAAGSPIVAAVEEQLGLKLRPQKISVPFLVVEHAERLPSEN